MRRRTPRRNPTLEAPRSVTRSVSDLSYDTSSRALNFVTDLLADKMDVIKRKAEMYTSGGYTEAANEMMKSWGLLKSAYDKALTDIRVVSRDEKGSPIDWAGTRQTQFAMDYADGAMRRFGDVVLNDIRSQRDACDAQIAGLNTQIRSLSQDMENLKASHRVDMAERSDNSSLQKKIESLQARRQS